MSRKRKALPLIEGLRISDVAAEGNALGRTAEDMVVFVPFCAPGDVVDVQIEKKRSSYAIGRVVRMVHAGDMRVEPRCEHFTVCGGCRWQHLPYEYQLQCKQKQVQDAMERIAKIPMPAISPILGSAEIWKYRNKMEYTFSNRCWLTREQLESGEDFPDRDAAGFHISGAFDKVLDINKCLLQDDLGNRVRLFVKNYAKNNGIPFYDLRAQQGLPRTLMIRLASTGESMVVLSFGADDKNTIKTMLDAVRAEFPNITSLMYVINTKCNDTIADLDIKLHSGREYIEEEMEAAAFPHRAEVILSDQLPASIRVVQSSPRLCRSDRARVCVRFIHRHRHYCKLCKPSCPQSYRHRICAGSHCRCKSQQCRKRHR